MHVYLASSGDERRAAVHCDLRVVHQRCQGAAEELAEAALLEALRRVGAGVGAARQLKHEDPPGAG
eukprot:scaffold33605_cov51-Phaeocystis_antarctica.AAC.1